MVHLVVQWILVVRLQNKLSEEEAKNGKGTARSALSGIGRVARFRRTAHGMSGQNPQEDPFMDPEAVEDEGVAEPLTAGPAAAGASSMAAVPSSAGAAAGAAEKGGAHD